MEPKDDTPLGTSTEAIVNTDFSVAVRKEKSIEILNRMLRSIMEGDGNIRPFVIGSKDGNIVVEECIVKEDGSVELPDIKVNTPEDIREKSKFIRRILKEISPVLKAEIENVTYVALMRKDSYKLNSMLKGLKDKKIKPRLENRAGCIWLVVGEEEFVL